VGKGFRSAGERPRTQPRQGGPVFTALKAYTAALKEVTNATDDATLDKASQGLVTAVGGLASAIKTADPKAPDIAPQIEAGGKLFELGARAYLDSRRYAALKKSVLAVDPAIDTIGMTIKAGLLAIRAQVYFERAQEMNKAALPFLDKNYAAHAAT